METYVIILTAMVGVLAAIMFFILREIAEVRSMAEPKKNGLSDAEIDQLRQVVAIMSYMGDAHEDKHKS